MPLGPRALGQNRNLQYCFFLLKDRQYMQALRNKHNIVLDKL